MARYEQTVTINLDPYIWQGGVLLTDWYGYCLAYVQTAVGSPNAGEFASQAAGRSNLVRDRNLPSGVWIILWFDHWGTYSGIYRNWGHVVLYKDGVIYSSPFSHKPYADKLDSIGAVESTYRATYIGWSLDLSGFAIAKLIADVQPSLQGYQRVVGNTKVAYRKTASRSGELIYWLDAGATVDFKGYVTGESVDGNNIWFVGRYTGGYTWSGAYTDTGTHDLPNLSAPPDTPTVPTSPAQPEVPDTPYTFTKAFDFVTNVIPAAQGNFAYKDIPPSPEGIVIHDFGTAGVDTYQSAVNQFTKKGSEVSIHFLFSQNKIVQMVDLADRAYHAKTGNSNWGFEIDPAYKNDPVQIANVRKTIAALQNLKQKKLTLHKHPEYVQTKCGDDVDLPAYEVPFPPETAPPSSSRDDEQDAKIAGIIGLIETIGKSISDFLAKYKK